MSEIDWHGIAIQYNEYAQYQADKERAAMNDEAETKKASNSAQSAWVIESENGFFIGETTYSKYGSGLGWVPGHMNALRFARKEDAEAVLRVCMSSFGIGLHENAKGVNEHMWYEE